MSSMSIINYVSFQSVRLTAVNGNNQSSWAGRRGYRATPGNQFLTFTSRLEKYHSKRFAMLKSGQNVPRTIFMQIRADITGKCMFCHISALSADSATFKVSNPIF